MCKVLSYLPLYLQSLVQCWHIYYLLCEWITLLLNSIKTQFLPYSIDTLGCSFSLKHFFSFGFAFSHYCSLIPLPLFSQCPLQVCISSAHHLHVDVSPFYLVSILPHVFSLFKGSHQPHRLNYHLSLSFSHLQPWSLSLLMRVIGTTYWNECLSQSIY